MDNTAIRFTNFGFKYNAQARPTLYDINFAVREGEKMLVVGPSGSGKSTLAHCINGLIPFSYPGEITGTLLVGGRDTKKESLFSLSKTVGTVLQDSDGQFIGLTVGEDIAFSLENDCVPQGEMISLTKEAAAMTGIETHLSHAPYELSGGQKQRVGLAGVIVDDVSILLFDEPLANLDPATGCGAIDLIDRVMRKTGTSVLIIEHRLEDVLYRHVDRVVLIGDGRVVADLPPNELLSAGFLGEYGIREPLYLTALKYSGVEITPEMSPENIDTMRLYDADTDKVKSWFACPAPPPRVSSGIPFLEVLGVNFSYDEGRKALSDISFTVYKGEMLAVAGTNGAGKSTLAKIICGFETPDSGRVLLSGKDLKDDGIALRGEKIGFVMQNPNQMISKAMIFDEVALGLRTKGLSESEIKQRVNETLEICGLYPFRSWPVSALSFGQKKRVTVASILVLRPEIIILDEPTAGQDFRHYTEIMEFLLRLNKTGVTIIMITHDMHLMLEYANRALVFSGGRMLADSTPAKILTDPKLVKMASLKETSLYSLAKRCGIENTSGFVQHFIDYDRRVRNIE
ncbi:MAG: DUF3744 domain-containing protein [Oscillospiraceae bacterium]|nr:DUF3744 domain-containing protein [Oscillospiraceae bacterium]